MAASREAKEVSFQAAESIIDVAKNNQAALVDAFVIGLEGTGNWPCEDNYAFTGDAEMKGRVEYRYLAEISALGNDLVIGNPGLRSLHFELRSEAARTGGNYDCNASDSQARFDSMHMQGVKRFAPRLQ